MLFHFLKAGFLILILNSCTLLRWVALQKQSSAKGVSFKPPSAPYQKIKKKDWDAFWINPKNQAQLGFFSNCSQSIGFASLPQLQKELISELENFRLVSQTLKTHQKQAARLLKLKKRGTLKKNITIEFFLFKKRNCFYVLNLLTAQKNPSPESHSVFLKFIKEFRIP